MDTLARLNNLVGKKGLLKVGYVGEIGFTFLSVTPSTPLPMEHDDAAFQAAITRSQFVVQFDHGTLVGGSNTKVVSGRFVSRIKGPS